MEQTHARRNISQSFRTILGDTAIVSLRFAILSLITHIWILWKPKHMPMYIVYVCVCAKLNQFHYHTKYTHTYICHNLHPYKFFVPSIIYRTFAFFQLQYYICWRIDMSWVELSRATQYHSMVSFRFIQFISALIYVHLCMHIVYCIYIYIFVH